MNANNATAKSGAGLSRKDRAELLESKLEAIENMLPVLTTKLETLSGDFYNYREGVVKRLDILEDEKIWKKDLPGMMPTQEDTDRNVKRISQNLIQNYQEHVERQFQTCDDKLIKIRKDFDMGKLNKELGQKAVK